MTLHACGDYAVIENAAGGEITLASTRGAIATWGDADIHGGTRTTGTAAYAACAVLADPARIAVVVGSALSLVDPMSGAVHRDVAGSTTGLIGFSPQGSHLLARVDGDLCVIDEDGEKRAVRTPDDMVLNVDSAAFAADGGRALVWSAISGQPRLAVIDLHAARAVQVWARRVTAAVVDARFTQAAIVNAPNDGVVLETLDFDFNRFRAVFRTRRSEHVRGVAADANLRVIAAHDSNSTLHVFRSRSASSWKRTKVAVGDDAVLVDVDRDRVVCHHRSLRVQRLDGPVVASLKGATRVCFAGHTCPNVDAAFLKDGALHVVERTSSQSSASARMIEGPAELRDIAPHPRGVVAVDDEDCAHVFDLAPAVANPFARERAP